MVVEKARGRPWFAKKLQEIGEDSQDRGNMLCGTQCRKQNLEYGRKEIPPLSLQHIMLFKGHNTYK